MKQFLKFIAIALLVMLGFSVVNGQVKRAKKPSAKESKGEELTNSAYLFVYFTGNNKTDEAIRFAISKNGYNYFALNHDQPVINSEKNSSTGGVRDPHILRGADGKTFYMVATDMVSAHGWDSNRAMVLLKSTDLVNWSSSVVNIQQKYRGQEDLLRVWAPQTIYDEKKDKYMIYWSMKNGNNPDIIYYAYANADFTDLEGEPKQLYYNPGNKSCIDADIILKDEKYHLFFKTEGNGNGIKQAISDSLTGGYVLQDKYLQQTTLPVEGSSVFKLNNGSGYILMYDMYTSGKYQFTYSKDLENFSIPEQEVSMDFHPRHGTVIPITTKEAEVLTAKWFSAPEVLMTAHSPFIKNKNISFDTTTSTLSLLLKPDASIKKFNPDFTAFPGITVYPKGATDFSKGPVSYRINIAGKGPKLLKVSALKYNNPVLDGYYADPEVLYSKKTNKYYIYPTSDGFNGWSGTYFKAFSSPDLLHWKDEGKILELGKDVKWADRNAWAPCIEEKMIDGRYQYFYYFTAAAKIGVAVADNPTGPFKDSGKPLISAYPPGITGGQQIDPDIFTDPATGKSYLYWGNGYMAGAELADDMTHIKEETIKVITPNKDFREGTYVFFRKGIYYFLWSENDTRDKNYCVKYGTSTSPLGKITVAPNNLVIAKDASAGIYGTGHNSILQLPGSDKWYIVYHRFNYPKGIQMGDAAGYNREVCIDKLEFNADGTIKPVIPTHQGVAAVGKK
ncbi:Glycosyl hydrolases family 43 [Mucilaginibacter pineti]|uniref:Glycosyl hydrolases family 43 n=1 Tax=Mucilaginibacter pineti TaxID=1391627 RepID=A0A1G6UPI4_9SPHI|nr:family 43 glycosylhydrolase [Mucilaginibacter pineti]SDD43252.1 Glycosyl hydrolases family 43 [Mucilaginibacter pineti]